MQRHRTDTNWYILGVCEWSQENVISAAWPKIQSHHRLEAHSFRSPLFRAGSRAPITSARELTYVLRNQAPNLVRHDNVSNRVFGCVHSLRPQF